MVVHTLHVARNHLPRITCAPGPSVCVYIDSALTVRNFLNGVGQERTLKTINSFVHRSWCSRTQIVREPVVVNDRRGANTGSRHCLRDKVVQLYNPTGFKMSYSLGSSSKDDDNPHRLTSTLTPY
jgi:hypothetical protein